MLKILLDINVAQQGEARLSELRPQLESMRASFEEYARNTIEELKKRGIETSSPESASDLSSECLLKLLQYCEPDTAAGIQETIDRHKRELLDLEQEVQRCAAAAEADRARAAQLRDELATLRGQLDGPPPRPRPETDGSPLEGVKRSKSELVLWRPSREDSSDPLEPVDPLSADEADDYLAKKMSLSLSLEPLGAAGEEPFPAAGGGPAQAPAAAAGALQPASSSDCALPAALDALPPFLRPDADDSDLSSTDEPRVVEGQSSSSVERSPEEKHQRAKYRRKLTSTW
ncbi:hypothetical protein ACJJTC_001114 [Scirpophaga incertulas]